MQGIEKQRLHPLIWCAKDRGVLLESEDAKEVIWGLASRAHAVLPESTVEAVTGEQNTTYLTSVEPHVDKLDIHTCACT